MARRLTGPSINLVALSADSNSMVEVVRFPNCREVPPGVTRLIVRRTRKAAYWVRRWSELNCRLSEADPKDVDKWQLEDASLYVLGWLHERNEAALKARGF